MYLHLWWVQTAHDMCESGIMNCFLLRQKKPLKNEMQESLEKIAKRMCQKYSHFYFSLQSQEHPPTFQIETSLTFQGYKRKKIDNFQNSNCQMQKNMVMEQIYQRCQNFLLSLLASFCDRKPWSRQLHGQPWSLHTIVTTQL